MDQLVAEDARRLNAQVRGLMGDASCLNGVTPLMVAAGLAHDAVVTRLLALGADMGLQANDGYAAVHVACGGNHPSTLALLLDAGASLRTRDNDGRTALMTAAYHEAVDCLKLLLARGGKNLDLDEADKIGLTALHTATYRGHAQIVELLVKAGADPTAAEINGVTPLDWARHMSYEECTRLLEAAVADSERARTLLKARTLLDTSYKIRQVLKSNCNNEDYKHEQQPPVIRRSPRIAVKHKALAAAQVYMKGRMAEGQELPRVAVVENPKQNEELVACVKYALGLEGGGGMLKELFVELSEMLVPKWDRANV